MSNMNPAAERVLGEVADIARAMGYDPNAVRGEVMEALCVQANESIPSVVLTTLARIARRLRVGDQMADRNDPTVTGKITDTWYRHPPGEVVTGLVRVVWDDCDPEAEGWHNGDALSLRERHA